LAGIAQRTEGFIEVGLGVTGNRGACLASPERPLQLISTALETRLNAGERQLLLAGGDAGDA
jgi:hypothetical protein